jgi:acetyl-CoA carboxylase alpha subunit
MESLKIRDKKNNPKKEEAIELVTITEVTKEKMEVIDEIVPEIGKPTTPKEKELSIGERILQKVRKFFEDVEN